jgi:hypothetical protein
MNSHWRDELEPEETDLVGQWVASGNHIEADPVCARINRLVAESLERLGSDASGWNTLYRDPRDGRLWELTYPNSEMHGGGPPRLTVIAGPDAATKYSSATD